MIRPADLSPVKTLALARLLAAADKGESETTLSKDLAPLVRHRWEGRDWADRLATALDELESAGAVGKIKSGKATRLALTDEGRRLASAALGIVGLPAKLTWAKLKTTHLPALALGRPGPAAINMKGEILRSRYGLDLGDGKPSIPQVTDRMAAKLMGLEPGRKFDGDNILRKLLLDAGIEIPPGQKPGPKAIGEALFRRELGDPSARKPLDLLATRSVGARQGTAAELAAAVLRSWVDRSEAMAIVEAPAAPPDGRTAPLDLPEFARRVAEAARTSPAGWFGDAKVFISRVWHALRDDPAFRGMDVADFKARLIEAHRARSLELGRADLVDSMAPADVLESATPYLNAVYHFVRVEEQDR